MVLRVSSFKKIVKGRGKEFLKLLFILLSCGAVSGMEGLAPPPMPFQAPHSPLAGRTGTR
jgi:carbon starvation protein CstA